MYLERATRYAGAVEHAELALPKSSRAPEEEALARYLDGRRRALLVILDERGKSFESRAFAEMLRGLQDQGATEVVFAVGGPHGYSPEMKKRAVMSWSLSPLTMAHELAATVAAEQIYRALTILNGHPYHND